MKHCYNNLLYHLIFPTKSRRPMISTEVLEKIKTSFKEKEIELEIKVFITNGIEDHIHSLVSIPPKHSVSHIVKHLKGYSSRLNPELTWSRGYSCLTVDESSFKRIYNYIATQQDHHTTYPRFKPGVSRVVADDTVVSHVIQETP